MNWQEHNGQSEDGEADSMEHAWRNPRKLQMIRFLKQ